MKAVRVNILILTFACVHKLARMWKEKGGHLSIKNNMGWDRELGRIYAELEEELSRLAPPCKACGQCCHFHTFGHILFSSNIEVGYILKNVGLPTDIQEGICPYLVNDRCTIRQYRTLGCRVFFCHPDWEEYSPEIYEKYHRKIKDLSLAYHLDWRYAPMLGLLSEACSEDYSLE